MQPQDFDCYSHELEDLALTEPSLLRNSSKLSGLNQSSFIYKNHKIKDKY